MNRGWWSGGFLERSRINLQNSPSLIKSFLTIGKLTNVSIVKIHVAWKRALLDYPFKHIFRLKAFTLVTNILIFKRKLLTFKSLESAAAWPIGDIWLFMLTEVRAGSDQNWGVGEESTGFTNTELHKTHCIRYHLQDISLHSRVGTLSLISLLLLPYFWGNSHTICVLEKFGVFFSSVPVPLVLS